MPENKSRMKRPRSKLGVGNVVRIDIDTFTFYAVIIDWPLTAFFDTRGLNISDPTELNSCNIAFKLLVTKPSFSKMGWTIVGNIDLSDKLREPVWLCNQDSTTGAYEISGSGPTLSVNETRERPATYEECAGLERRAAWSAIHVETRLIDFAMNKPNKSVASLAVLPLDEFWKRRAERQASKLAH